MSGRVETRWQQFRWLLTGSPGWLHPSGVCTSALRVQIPMYNTFHFVLGCWSFLLVVWKYRDRVVHVNDPLICFCFSWPSVFVHLLALLEVPNADDPASLKSSKDQLDYCARVSPRYFESAAVELNCQDLAGLVIICSPIIVGEI